MLSNVLDCSLTVNVKTVYFNYLLYLPIKNIQISVSDLIVGQK